MPQKSTPFFRRWRHDLKLAATAFAIGMTERSTVLLLRIKGISKSVVFTATYGLYIFSGLLGLIAGLTLFDIMGLSLSLMNAGLGLLPLVVSTILLYINLNKQ